MAVCPFCLPWPRTSVTVMPDTLSLPSASFTSSTLFGRTMVLMSFICALQHALQVGGQRMLRRVRQLGSCLSDVEHVDRLFALGRNQHEIDVAAVARYHAADAMEQSDGVGRNDIQDGI